MAKALSIHQPWAGLIASGDKTVEIRSWPTRYRGPLVICSTKREMQKQIAAMDLPDRAMMARYIHRSGNRFWHLGAALALVELVDCRPMTPLDARKAITRYDGKMWSWYLENVRLIRPPLLVKGRQRIWNLDLTHLEPVPSLLSGKG